MSDWISAREALGRIKNEGLTGDDLIEWARRGSLRTRAQSGTFSDDDPVIERMFPPEAPTDEIARSVQGPWPDIPVDFWQDEPTKSLWGAGTFSARMTYFEEYYQQNQTFGITLFGVTFHAGDLADLLLTPVIPPPRGKLPKNAKPNDRLYEDVAHHAADLLRSGFKKSDALRKALDQAPPAIHILEASRLRALRQAFDRMYDECGFPIQN